MTLISISLYPHIKKQTAMNLNSSNPLQVQIHSRYKGDTYGINAHGKIYCFFLNCSPVFELTIALEQPITFNKKRLRKKWRHSSPVKQWKFC